MRSHVITGDESRAHVKKNDLLKSDHVIGTLETRVKTRWKQPLGEANIERAIAAIHSSSCTIRVMLPLKKVMIGGILLNTSIKLSYTIMTTKIVSESAKPSVSFGSREIIPLSLDVRVLLHRTHGEGVQELCFYEWIYEFMNHIWIWIFFFFFMCLMCTVSLR